MGKKSGMNWGLIALAGLGGWWLLNRQQKVKAAVNEIIFTNTLPPLPPDLVEDVIRDVARTDPMLAITVAENAVTIAQTAVIQATPAVQQAQATAIAATTQLQATIAAGASEEEIYQAKIDEEAAARELSLAVDAEAQARLAAEAAAAAMIAAQEEVARIEEDRIRTMMAVEGISREEAEARLLVPGAFW